MLYYETINTKTLELLKDLQQIPIFENLRLVWGTSLALQIGHRTSVDLDLFGELKADKQTILTALKKNHTVKTIQFTNNIYLFIIDDIKVDIVNYTYPWLEKDLQIDDIKLASVTDIASMKIAAITNRGSKKDFIDLFYLLNRFSLKQMIDFYKAKYDDATTILALKSLTYFDDAEQDLMPTMFKEISWQEVKTKMINEVNTFVREESES